MAEMTEKQRMLAGQLYLASDPELVAERRRARHLLRLYNQTTAEEADRRSTILAELFGRVGPKVEIESPFSCDYGYNICAGNNLYMNFGCVVLDCGTVDISDNVLCGPYVQICAGYHPVDPELRLTGRELAGPIRIGSNVWIGGAIIGQVITIGDNTTIGAGSVVTAAGSVVTRDVPANVVAAGNPCRIIRQLG